MDEVFAWAEEQREKNRREFYRLLDHGRRIWTPPNIFNQCCVKWLVDGPPMDDDYEYFNAYSPRNGCNGCNRDHPCIKLRFDVLPNDTNSTTARLSHALDPFVEYFQGLVDEGKALSIGPTTYQMNDYLRPVENALYSHAGFGNHLVKVEQGSREASDAAQSAELAERERASKRPRLMVSEDDGTVTTATSSSNMIMDEVMKVMDVVFGNQRVIQDLQNDPVALFCMRHVCKSFQEKALSIAAEKVKTLDLSITPLVNGTGDYGDSRWDGYDTETFDTAGRMFDDGPNYRYDKKDKVFFAHSDRDADGRDEEVWHYPVDSDAATFDWDSGELRKDLYEEDDEGHYDASWADYAYRGQLLRAYWNPKGEDPVKPERGPSFWDEEKPPLGILVKEIHFFEPPNVGIVSKSGGGVTIEYEVLESDAVQRVEETYGNESLAANDASDESSESSSSVASNSMIYVKYSGRVKLIKMKVDFGVIVRAHARKINGELMSKYDKILKGRPLTKTEKEYLELVVNAAQ